LSCKQGKEPHQGLVVPAVQRHRHRRSPAPGSNPSPVAEA
jgi:hypothetical protein